TTDQEPPVTAAQTGVNVPTEDDYLTKLLTYVPLEIVGAYIFLAGTISSNVTDKSAHRWWLGALLVAMLAMTAVYDWRVPAWGPIRVPSWRTPQRSTCSATCGSTCSHPTVRCPSPCPNRLTTWWHPQSNSCWQDCPKCKAPNSTRR